ncbi:Morn repeat protein [Pandoravirus inopinatum]|uniref:Morn repeat protein n=1 Tax=Pandoravirus inopinatum TaxID=1605721 RepID=A0A0B5J185_9VIRU|nr:Morn repeat protein [Pandoravirus inopinatum]AJF97219.1 Morn repeat protein [Pandoravirus inopinatum]
METHIQIGHAADAQPNFFDILPDELVLAVFAALGDDPRSVLDLGATCTRHHALSIDDRLWRDMCQLRFGHPLHTRAHLYGKDGRWVYRAQACAGDMHTPVGAVDISTGMYCGDLVDGLPHGYGASMQRPALGRLEGQSMHRRSAADVRASNCCEGEWHKGQAHGYVIYNNADGSIYRGMWENGRRHGHGTTINAHGSRHVGIWHAGECPFGTSTAPAGNIWHTGEWKKGRPHGHGTARLESGATYKGGYADGVRSGYGVYTCTDGTTIQGIWEADTLTGYAICTDHVAGTRYEGMWANNMSMGFGVQSYGDGSRLAALWDGVKHSCGNVATHRSSDVTGDRCANDPCAACVALVVGTSNLPLGRNTP